MVGDAVVAVSKFHNGTNKALPGVEKDMRGIVQKVDEDGDYFVKWEPTSDSKPTFNHWAFRSRGQIHRLSGDEVFV